MDLLRAAGRPADVPQNRPFMRPIVPLQEITCRLTLTGPNEYDAAVSVAGQGAESGEAQLCSRFHLCVRRRKNSLVFGVELALATGKGVIMKRVHVALALVAAAGLAVSGFLLVRGHYAAPAAVANSAAIVPRVAIAGADRQIAASMANGWR